MGRLAWVWSVFVVIVTYVLAVLIDEWLQRKDDARAKENEKDDPWNTGD